MASRAPHEHSVVRRRRAPRCNRSVPRPGGSVGRRRPPTSRGASVSVLSSAQCGAAQLDGSMSVAMSLRKLRVLSPSFSASLPRFLCLCARVCRSVLFSRPSPPPAAAAVPFLRCGAPPGAAPSCTSASSEPIRFPGQDPSQTLTTSHFSISSMSIRHPGICCWLQLTVPHHQGHFRGCRVDEADYCASSRDALPFQIYSNIPVHYMFTVR